LGKKKLVDYEQLEAEAEDKKRLGKAYQGYNSLIEVDLLFIDGIGFLGFILISIARYTTIIPYQIFLLLIVYLLVRYYLSRGRLRFFPLNRYSILASILPSFFLMAVNFWINILFYSLNDTSHYLFHIFGKGELSYYLPHILTAALLFKFVFYLAKDEKKKVFDVLQFLVATLMIGHGVGILINALFLPLYR